MVDRASELPPIGFAWLLRRVAVASLSAVRTTAVRLMRAMKVFARADSEAFAAAELAQPLPALAAQLVLAALVWALVVLERVC